MHRFLETMHMGTVSLRMKNNSDIINLILFTYLVQEGHLELICMFLDSLIDTYNNSLVVEAPI